MGVSSITPALPLIARTFEISVSEVAMLITVFTLPGIILTPALGVLADLIGRKKVMVPSMLVFGLAGFACTFAQTYDQLLLFRFIQGTGTAALGSLNVTIIGDIFKGKERAEAMGYNSGVLSFGATLYPAIGGALALFGWYYPFFLPLLAIPVAFIIMAYLDNPEPLRDATLSEYFGNVRRGLSNRRVLLLFVATMVSFSILYGPILTIIPFLLEDRFGASSLIIGIVLGTVAISNGSTAMTMGKLITRFSAIGLLKFSFLLYTISLLLIPAMPAIAILIIPVMMYGLAQGINLPVIITMVSNETTAENRATIMSMNGMVLRISQTFAPLLMSFVYAQYGFSGVYLISAFLAATMGLILLFRLKPRHGID